MHDKVLIIDDSMALHKLITAHLADDSMGVHSAYDGESGLRMAADMQPSLILLDVEMSKMDGFEVCKRLQSNKETMSIPVIFLTADSATADKVRALKLGAVDYITKPFNYAELQARVQSSLRARRNSEQRAMIDGLTGLWNKAYLDEHLEGQLSLSKRTGQPLSCIVVDVDGLGSVNTLHGWQVGNDALRAVSRLTLGQCRAEDAVCYCGAGRFFILVSGMDRRAAAQLADRLCLEIQRQCVVIHGKEVGLTCGFGVADSSVAGEGSLLTRAEVAMTRAKQSGRGAVSIARPLRTKALATA